MTNVDDETGVERFQAFVEMRDGVKLNTFVFLPKEGHAPFPVILQRTPYESAHRSQ
jgi:predicted acyl esterase